MSGRPLHDASKENYKIIKPFADWNIILCKVFLVNTIVTVKIVKVPKEIKNDKL